MHSSQPSTVKARKLASGAMLLCLPMFLPGCAGMAPIERPAKTEAYRPAASLLVRQPVAEWPATMTNGELLDLARAWRAQLLECNADKAAIERDAGASTTDPDKPAESPTWWQFWKGRTP